MKHVRTIILLLKLSAPVISYRYQNYFPPEEEEYDPFKFDPNSLFGAPLGGWSRASRSRLAALPMRLVGDSIFWENEKEHAISEDFGKSVGAGPYFTMRDGMGRKFTCLIYSEDELTAESLSQSMFDAPVERIGADDDKMSEDEDNGVIKDKNDAVSDENENVKENIKNDDGSNPNDVMEVFFVKDLSEYLAQGSTEKATTHAHLVNVKSVLDKLKELEGVCTLLHTGWWSYEWCYNDKVTQFHVQMQGYAYQDSILSNDELPEFVVQSISTIGSYSGRTLVMESEKFGRSVLDKDDDYYNVDVDVDDDDDDDDDDGGFNAFQNQKTKLPVTPRDNDGDETADSRKDDDFDDYGDSDSDTVVEADDETQKVQAREVQDPKVHATEVSLSDGGVTAIVALDTYTDGEYCEEAKKNREVKVQLTCCNNQDILNSLLSANGASMQDSDFLSKSFENSSVARAILLNIEEGSVCSYIAHVCTNVLCQEWLDDVIVDKTKKESGMFKINSATIKNRVEIDRDSSIRMILDSTLQNNCLKRNEGWWTYNFCYQSAVNQFHESVNVNAESGALSTEIEAKHVLGEFDPVAAEGFPDEDEIKHVVFPQGQRKVEADGGKEAQASQQSLVVNSAYFMQEYVNGDVCEGEDVIDSAIKGGEVGERGIQRATTVRYFCGNTKGIVRINEDHTCHYIIDITVPELCKHKYFEVPHIKKHAVKCLPVD